MSFAPVGVDAKSSTRIHGRHGEIVVSLYKKDASSNQQICFRIGADLMKQFGWKVGDTVNLNEGNQGKDIGYVRIVVDRPGPFVLARADKAGAAWIRLGFGGRHLQHYRPSLERVSAEKLYWTIFASDLTIKLPEWMVFTPPSNEALV